MMLEEPDREYIVHGDNEEDNDDDGGDDDVEEPD
ncbi:unnamed protein product [Schistosoma mattheei]|uniref:Uncharacterized protein n=1 Tax=Schistosoma mattheei TaxID=31246 RepID=A0A3P8EMA6_9TREM|nr:unnamed protein product [Schistosoma mattheei]